MSIVNEMDIIQEEIDRVYAEPAISEQAVMIQSDMKQWALKEGHWPQMDYIHMIAAHAVARGWTQESFSGMEIIEQ